MLRKILIIAGCVCLFLVTLYVLIFLMFPTEYVRHLAEKKIEQALKQEQSVEIGQLKISPFLNVRLRNISITPRVGEEDEQPASAGGDFDGYFCAPVVESIPFVIKSIFVNPKVMNTVRGNPDGKFDIELDSDAGTIDGSLKTKDKIMEILASGKDISLNDFALLSNLTHMQIYGDLGFDVRTIIEKNKLAELSLSMASKNTVLCPKRLKLSVGSLPYFDLPFTVFGDINADVEIKKDHLVINSLTTSGPDIQLNVTGDIQLKSKETPNPKLNIHAEILPSQDWITNNSMQSIYKLCEKHDDGSILLDLTGSTKKPKFDCGTPIIEPSELKEVPKKAEPPKDDKPEVKVEEPKKEENVEPKPPKPSADDFPPPPPPNDGGGHRGRGGRNRPDFGGENGGRPNFNGRGDGGPMRGGLRPNMMRGDGPVGRPEMGVNMDRPRPRSGEIPNFGDERMNRMNREIDDKVREDFERNRPRGFQPPNRDGNGDSGRPRRHNRE